MSADTPFPADFLWGAATSAYQIEGSPLADGAGESIWHRFSHTHGKIIDGGTGDVACDHYRRYAEDVHLMSEIGLGAYRFSTSWPRVLPDGIGRPNPTGLDFYSRLVDSLLDCRIKPMVTLYHWDLPAVLEDRGGWANPQSADWFADYAQLMFRSLGDRVTMWVTINEPWVIVDQGYVEGHHAPGRQNWVEAAVVSKNLLRAHAAAVAVNRSAWEHKIGLAVNLVPIVPASENAADSQAADRLDTYLNRQFLDPVLLGEIPGEMVEMFGGQWPQWAADEVWQIGQPIDFVGINYYLRLAVRNDPAAGPAQARAVLEPNCPRTAMGWEIHPQGLLEILQWVKGRYGEVPLYITENGAAFDEETQPTDTLNDPQRVKYLRDHLRAAGQAIEAGIDLRGYFLWSLLDNFEWQMGYSKRFGIISVNFETQRRVPKSSARFYSSVIRGHGAELKG